MCPVLRLYGTLETRGECHTEVAGPQNAEARVIDMNLDATNMTALPITKPPGGPGRDTLALIYQEILTVISRLRSNRQTVMDVGAFRGSMKAAIAAAEVEATRKGYSAADARLATFAVVAFLDESMETAKDLGSTDWARQALQVEFFGEHTAGDIFFECIDKLIARSDAAQDADVLEVFALCLLLGFQGRYSTKGPEGIRPVVTKISAKIQRIRGQRTLAPDWEPKPDTVLRPPRDPWVRALALGTVGAILLAVLFFVGFNLALLSGASGLHAVTLFAPH
jgi:type VI secretion system protein ImpK